MLIFRFINFVKSIKKFSKRAVQFLYQKVKNKFDTPGLRKFSSLGSKYSALVQQSSISNYTALGVGETSRLHLLPMPQAPFSISSIYFGEKEKLRHTFDIWGEK
jgi:hypothetical protein